MKLEATWRAGGLEAEEVADLLADAALKLGLVLTVELAALDVGARLDVGLGKHAQHGEEDAAHTLDGRPAFRRRLVPQRVVAGRVEDGDADGAVRVDCPSAAEQVRCGAWRGQPGAARQGTRRDARTPAAKRRGNSGEGEELVRAGGEWREGPPAPSHGRLTVGMQQRRVKHHLERVERVVGRERELGREHAALLAVSLLSIAWKLSRRLPPRRALSAPSSLSHRWLGDAVPSTSFGPARLTYGVSSGPWINASHSSMLSSDTGPAVSVSLIGSAVRSRYSFMSLGLVVAGGGGGR